MYEMWLYVDTVSHKCDARRGQDGYLVSLLVMQLDDGHAAVYDGGWLCLNRHAWGEHRHL